MPYRRQLTWTNKSLSILLGQDMAIAEEIDGVITTKRNLNQLKPVLSNSPQYWSL